MSGHLGGNPVASHLAIQDRTGYAQHPGCTELLALAKIKGSANGFLLELLNDPLQDCFLRP